MLLGRVSEACGTGLFLLLLLNKPQRSSLTRDCFSPCIPFPSSQLCFCNRLYLLRSPKTLPFPAISLSSRLTGVDHILLHNNHQFGLAHNNFGSQGLSVFSFVRDMSTNPPSSGAQPPQPPVFGSVGSQNFGPSISMQYQPAAAQQQAQQFIPAGSQQFWPGQNQQMHFSQPMQQGPPRPGQPGHLPPSPQAFSISMSYGQSAPVQAQHNTQPSNSHTSGVGVFGMPPSSSYTFTPPPYGQPPNGVNVSSQYQPLPQMLAPVTPAGGQPWLSSTSQSAPIATTGEQISQQPAAMVSTVPATTAQPNSSIQSLSDWQEHTAADGRRYYYNKKTRQSSWEKPLELMTPLEKADASTVWKEFTTSDGRKYYYNKETKQSKWTIPDELKLAREQAEKMSSVETQTEVDITAQPLTTVDVPKVEMQPITEVTSSPVSVTPAVAAASSLPVVSAGSQNSPVVPSSVSVGSVGGPSPVESVNPHVSLIGGVPNALSTDTTLTNALEKTHSQDVANSTDGASVLDLEEAKKGMAAAGKINVTQLEEKVVDDEPLVYASKQEAKNAFKALLESVNVQSDWSWEKAMRIIVGDKRYGALRTLGERKQAFNEYLGQRRKQEAEERRVKQKKARQEFTKMLEESEELTSSTKWSKATSMFEDDERFKAVEHSRDREELYDNYLIELAKKERVKAQEEHMQNLMEYRHFLESCTFIKVNSLWRKVQDQLEDDERCSRLEKIDRLKGFQEYIWDLEKDEEEQKKIQKEKLRRSERKNRDDFRKLLEDDVDAGVLTAKTSWRDYCIKVKETPEYMEVASNTSGSTPKDLFEDVAEELEKQYHDDKSRIKDAIKLKKVTLASTWSLEDFKDAILEDITDPEISEINLKLVFDDLIERIKEKEEKEARKRQHQADDFLDLLYSIKEISSTSTWEDSKPFFEPTPEYRSIVEESFAREIFEEHITLLQEKAKEKELKREKEKEEKEKRKEKERKEKEREKLKEKEKEKEKERSRKDETEGEVEVDVIDVKEERRKDRKHRKRHHSSAADELSSDRDEKEDSKRSRRHSSDRKKSRKHAYTPESDTESSKRSKRHKRDHRESSRRGSAYEDLEDGELGEDGEIQ